MPVTSANPERPADILVVEDSASQAHYLARLMESDGYRVRIAVNGREGLRAARESAPALIVSDIAMPEMDGFALCHAVRQDARLRDIPVILLTSLTSLYDVIKGLDCGADNFIRKPFDSTYLLGRIRYILASRALRSDARVQMGMQVSLGGQTHFITAERQQIFDLLISTYEEAIQMTEQLKAQQQRIARSYRSLEGLYRLAEALNPALTEQAVGELALEHLLDFPGVRGACIKLFDADGALRLVATRNFEVDPHGSGSGCHCGRQLQAGGAAAPQPCAPPHACIALATGAGTGGVLLISGSGPLSADQKPLLETVGNQIAVAVERARLYRHMEAQVRERTEAWQSEHKLLTAVVHTSGALVCSVDAGGIIRMFNPACEETMGWPAAEAIGQPCWDVFRESDAGRRLWQFFQQPPASSRRAQVRGEWLARDGGARALIWSTAWLRNGDGTVDYFLGTGLDVTELRGAEEKLRYLSNFDALTGLPNRTLMRERMRQLQQKDAAGGRVIGYLLLNPERLQLVGESLGADAEQAMLVQIAERLGQWGHGEAAVGRVGERSFAIIAARQDATGLSVLARQVLAVMGAPFHHEQQPVHLDPCIGIALFPNDGGDFDGVAQSAEAAMRRAQSGKAERYEFYRPELNEGARQRFRFECDLRRALERDEFLLHYQPQVSLVSGAIVGVEALLRWRHPELGMLAPGRFIGIAEETGLILPIGEWVLRRACEQSCAWQQAGLPPVPVSVNLSARQFTEGIAATVGRILAETGLEPRLLELELTESASMEDPQKSVAILRRLKDMGVRLAIDDFGTGYSNLNYLKRFPVDRLKLDQSFVKDISCDPDDLSIARAVIAMAHGLRLAIVAEGVETAEQLALLADNGCDEIQGYFFSPPVDPAACGEMLRARKSLALDALLRAPYQPTLLYVDDEANMLAAIRRELRHQGYRVLVAASAADAFGILATHRVGVILCDQRMPGMGGTELLSRVKQMYPNVTRMVLSGHTDLQSLAGAVNQGAIFKFLAKPWDDKELAAAVREGFAAFDAACAAPRRALRP